MIRKITQEILRETIDQSFCISLYGFIVEYCWKKMNKKPNKHIHTDNKKRRSFLALLFAAGDVRRYSEVK